MKTELTVEEVTRRFIDMDCGRSVVGMMPFSKEGICETCGFQALQHYRSIEDLLPLAGTVGPMRFCDDKGMWGKVKTVTIQANNLVKIRYGLQDWSSVALLSMSEIKKHLRF